MKVKNINPVEQHVEKGILALCILAAGYLGYSALTSPLEFTDAGSNETVKVKEVEERISKEVERMNKDNNLDPRLLALRFPAMNPAQRLGRGPDVLPPGTTADLKLVALPQAPKAPVVAEALPPGHFVVRPVDSAVTPAGGPGVAPVALAPTDVVKEFKPVKVTAQYDLKGNFATINGAEIKPEQRIDPELTKDVVYLGVEVQWAEVNPDSNKATEESEWHDLPLEPTEKVPPIPSGNWGDSNAVRSTLDTFSAVRGAILEPRFYQGIAAPIIKEKSPAPVPAPVAPTGGGRPAPPPGAVSPPVTPAPGATPAPTDTGPTVLPAAPMAILTEASTPTAPLVAYDTRAVPGHQYKYRMRVVIANPAYNAGENLDPKQKALEPNFKSLNDQPTLHSDWSPESVVFTMEPDQTFYVAAARSLMAKFKIWQLINAKWEHGEADVLVGDTVSAAAEAAKPAPPDATDTTLATDYLVVDSTPGKVVLMNVKDGKLEVRDAGTDKAAAEKRTQRDKDATDAEAVPKPAAP